MSCNVISIYINIYIYIYIGILIIRTYVRTYVRTYIHTYIYVYAFVSNLRTQTPIKKAIQGIAISDPFQPISSYRANHTSAGVKSRCLHVCLPSPVMVGVLLGALKLGTWAPFISFYMVSFVKWSFWLGYDTIYIYIYMGPLYIFLYVYIYVYIYIRYKMIFYIYFFHDLDLWYP